MILVTGLNVQTTSVFCVQRNVNVQAAVVLLHSYSNFYFITSGIREILLSQLISTENPSFVFLLGEH